jgi:hypothetical protein
MLRYKGGVRKPGQRQKKTPAFLEE